MLIAFGTSTLKQTRWYEYLIRFTLGGAVTAIAHILGEKYGPEFGGLFLAFPAILAASVTLVEKHERERKEKEGLHGKYRGRRAAGADAAGAAMGSFGLMAFAWFVWKFVPDYNAALVSAGAIVIWAALSVAIWWTWKWNVLHRLRHRVMGMARLDQN